MAKPTPASPWEYQFDQPLLVAVCQRCHRALSLPRTKSSRRPSRSCAIAMGLVKPPPALPWEYQFDQPLLTAVCSRCHRLPSLPVAKKSSRRPSALELMDRLHACLPIVTTSGSEEIPLAITYSSEAPCSIICGTVNSVVCTALPVATPM